MNPEVSHETLKLHPGVIHATDELIEIFDPLSNRTRLAKLTGGRFIWHQPAIRIRLSPGHSE